MHSNTHKVQTNTFDSTYTSQIQSQKYIGRCQRPAGGGLGSENGDLALNGDRVSI